MRKILTFLFCLLIALSVSSCAKNPTSPYDPYEKLNRVSFAFNQCVDHLALRPAAKIYKTIVPPPLQKGVTNFFNNVLELQTLPNDILQGKIRYAFIDFWRFVINSTIGIGGLFDVATRMGLPKHYEDFGLTLAYWSGGKPSPYFVIPLLGSSTFRAAFGKPADIATCPWIYITPHYIRWTAAGLYAVNTRARLWPANKLIDTSFDPYVFVRHAYMTKRLELIRNNEKPFKTTLELKRERKKAQQANGHVPITREQLVPNDDD